MTRSAPESPGRGCPIATDGKNSIPHTAYYSTVELVIEFSNRHIQRRRIGPGFRWKNHYRDRVHPDPTTTPLAWNYLYWKRTCLRQSSHLEALSVHSMSKSGCTYPNTNLAVQPTQQSTQPTLGQTASQLGSLKTQSRTRSLWRRLPSAVVP